MADAIILLYHRVTSLESDPQLLAVTPENFKAHLNIIEGFAAPLSLSQLFDGMQRNAIPENSVAVTFDDGYADNFYGALPLLTRYGIPATFFITSGQIGTDSEFWWDELERCILLHGGNNTGRCTLPCGDDRVEFDPADDSEDAPKDRTGPAAWNVLAPPVTGRQKAYHRLSREIRDLPPSVRQGLMDIIRSRTGSPSTGRSTHRALAVDELRELSRTPLAEIGCHTASHPVLSYLSPARQQAEITASKRFLEGVIQKPVRGFSYPFGGPRDYTPDTRGILMESGFHYACANTPGSVGKNTDPFQLPRFIVRNWDGKAFERHLLNWLRSKGNPT